MTFNPTEWLQEYDHLLDKMGDQELASQMRSDAHDRFERAFREGDEPLYFELETLDAVMNAPSKQWLINQIIGERDTLMIFGPSGSGKTFISYNLMMILALGEGKFAGVFPVNKPANVVYMTAEGRSGLGQRTLAAVRSFGLTTEQKERCRILRKVAQFISPDADNYYERFLDDLVAQGFNPDVVIIDHLSSTVPGKGDSDQAAATLVAEAISCIQDKLGCAVVLIHHTGYDTSHSRGMTNYKDFLDVQVKVVGDCNPRTMSCEKNKDGLGWNDREFYIKPVEGTGSCTIEWGGEIASEQDKKESQLDLLAEMIEGAPGLNQTQVVGQAVEREGWGRNLTLGLLKTLEERARIEKKKVGNAWRYYTK